MSSAYAPQAQPSNGMATAGMVLGIIAAAFAWMPIVGVIAWFLLIPGAALSGVGFARAREIGVGRGQAVAGMALNGAAFGFCMFYVLLLAVSA